MSYQTGTATDPQDLVNKLFTFLTGTPGWTQNYLDLVNDRASIASPGGNINHNFSWQTDSISLAMSTGLASPLGSVDFWNEVGTENASSTVSTHKHVNNISGPYTAYHFFEDVGYCHVVLEYSAGLYRHFGMGQLNGISPSLEGLDYSYGHFWSQSTSAIDDPVTNQHSPPWAGGNTTGSTTRVTSMYSPNLAGLTPGKWLRLYNTLTGLNDPDGQPEGAIQCHGWQGGMHLHAMGIAQSQLNGFKPLIPIAIFQWLFAPTPDQTRLLGYVPDTRVINLDGVTVGEEFSVGGDTWIAYPIVRKIYVPGTSFDEEQSFNFGLAYKKVTT